MNKQIPQSWKLKDIPLKVRPPSLASANLLEKVFTGRESELKTALLTLSGSLAKNIFIYGWFGIGKSALIIEMLRQIQESIGKSTLITYVNLPQEATNLASISLIALARQMPNDYWAQQVLNNMGVPTQRMAVKKSATIGTEFAKAGEETLSPGSLVYPTISFEDLVDRALKKYERVIIAIDDLDKQDPSQARELMRSAQGILKGKASFILTGHPVGITRDIYTSELGLFDIHVELKPLSLETMEQMLMRYLASARINNNTNWLKKLLRFSESKSILDSEKIITPFTPDTFQELCKRSFGIPRYLNRLGQYVLTKACVLNVDCVTPDILEQGLKYADEQVRSSIDPVQRQVIEMTLERGMLSDDTITYEDLRRLNCHEFQEVLPILENLTKLDLLRRLDTDHGIEFGPSPLLWH